MSKNVWFGTVPALIHKQLKIIRLENGLHSHKLAWVRWSFSKRKTYSYINKLLNETEQQFKLPNHEKHQTNSYIQKH